MKEQIQTELIKALEEYQQLLSNEITSMITIATIHGWRSDNSLAGVNCRKKIADLKNALKECE